jgi:hypothetical protein
MRAKAILAVLSSAMTAGRQLSMESYRGVKAALEKDLLAFTSTSGASATGSKRPLKTTENKILQTRKLLTLPESLTSVCAF